VAYILDTDADSLGERTMKTVWMKTALAGLLVLGASMASAEVKVTYVEPDKFVDLPFSPWDREDVLKRFTTHFNKLGERLPQGQDLTIEVTDIDLAGREYPSLRSGRDLRVMQGMADWPVMHLRYSVTQNGAVLKTGDAKLSDMSYQQRISRFSDGDSLRYEKRMIDEWFDETILEKKRGS
jgi:hypothetical protein